MRELDENCQLRLVADVPDAMEMVSVRFSGALPYSIRELALHHSIRLSRSQSAGSGECCYDSMQQPGSIERSVDEQLSATPWGATCQLDLSNQGHCAMSVSETTCLCDADGIVAAALEDHVVLVGGSNRLASTPAPSVILHKVTGQVRQLQAPPSAGVIRGHTLTGLGDGRRVLLLGGEHHHACTSLVCTQSASQQAVPCPSLPPLTGHSAVLLPASTAAVSQVLVTGGKHVITGAWNRDYYLLTIGPQLPIHATQLTPVSRNFPSTIGSD
ncbi:hypothetical protein WJX74_006910 [Apatococcus lobatus]